MATPIADRYREVAAKILAAAEEDVGGWQKLAYLTDRIGHRIAGSPSLERAVEWAVEAMTQDGHEGVRAERVMVPRWVRGEEHGRILTPLLGPLSLIGLGGTVATPRGGLTADVVVVHDFAELEALGEAGVKGKIVLFNHPMVDGDERTGPNYGQAVVYRGRGPNEAAKLGAVGALVRSLTTRSMQTPHTGYHGFADGVKPIPSAAVSIEDADRIDRLTNAGERVQVELVLSGKWHAPSPSANVIAELRGREKPEEIVVIAAHLDSWDVGQGAHDDGAGCAIVMQALTVLRELGLTPRRTIRVVLYTDEESSQRGGTEYVAMHADELNNHVMALEADTGGFAPIGFHVIGDAEATARAKDIASLLARIGATSIGDEHAGADIAYLIAKGVPGLGLWMDRRSYFDYHHSAADTLDKVRPEDLRRDIAAVAVMAYVVADMPERLGKAPPSP